MEYITSKEAAEKWGVSERMVRVYCVQERIPDAYQEFEIWYIPVNAAKPTRKKKEASQLPLLHSRHCLRIKEILSKLGRIKK